MKDPGHWLLVAPMLFGAIVGRGIGEAQWKEAEGWLAFGIGGGIGILVGGVLPALYKRRGIPFGIASGTVLALVVIGVAGALGDKFIGGAFGGHIGVGVLLAAAIACGYWLYRKRT